MCRSSPGELVAKHEMQRELGRRTGTCFQRCVGLDAIGTCHSVTFDIDAKNGTDYHQRFLAFLKRAQAANVVIGGAMTDPKGDRSKAPHQQTDPDLFLHVIERDDKGIYVSGAKMHQTGAVNSHWLIFMPTMRMTEADRDWSVVGAVRVDAPGLTYIVGRQTNDTRIVDGGAMDAGNAQFAGQELLIVFEDVFVPHEHVFMDGEWEFATSLVERFTTYHRSSYVCKTGLGRRADRRGGVRRRTQRRRSGVAHQGQARRDDASQRDDLFELHGGAHQSKPMASGTYINDEMLSNVAKHNVTRFPYEIARLAQDIAGGLVVTMPSEKDLQNNEIGPLIRKFLQGRDGVEVDRPHAHPAPDREHDDRPQRRRLSDRKPARRRLAAGATHPDRARHEDRGEEGARPPPRRRRSDRIEVVDFQERTAAIRLEWPVIGARRTDGIGVGRK